LRIELPLKFKTKPCAWYHFKKSCKFGTRCTYMHSEAKVTGETLEEFTLDPLYLFFKDYEMEKKGFFETCSYVERLKQLGKRFD